MAWCCFLATSQHSGEVEREFASICEQGTERWGQARFTLYVQGLERGWLLGITHAGQVLCPEQGSLLTQPTLHCLGTDPVLCNWPFLPAQQHWSAHEVEAPGPNYLILKVPPVTVGTSLQGKLLGNKSHRNHSAMDTVPQLFASYFSRKEILLELAVFKCISRYYETAYSLVCVCL
jgi:hypothetical protein